MASKVRFSSRKMRKQNTEAVYKGLDMLAFSFQRRLKKMLSKPGGGEKKPWHINAPSLEGQPPAKQTGRLGNSWSAGKRRRKVKFGKPVISLTQGTGFGEAVKYAAILEDPKRHNRPFIVPTVRLFRGSRAQRIFSSVYLKHLSRINRTGPHG